MKVVVTGGSGKFGQWMTREMLAHGHHVTSFDRSEGGLCAGAQYIRGNITDLGQVFGALAGAEAVIHLAGIPTHGIVSNEVTFHTNVIGTFNVHEVAWRLQIRRVVTMSSEAVLGWAPGAWEREHVPEYLPIDENHACRPQDCYGLSKQVCETIARSYTNKCGLETVAIRAPWIITPEELRKLSEDGGREQPRFSTFHYIDVRDLAGACRLAVERPLSGHHTLFVGSGESTSREPLCEILPRLMPALGDRARALTVTEAAVSIERAKATLGWEPKWFWRMNSAT